MIFGQDAAIAEVASAIKMARSGLRAPEKPIGSFLFAGPTGVGKTELARQLARILGVEFIRYDMSEYMEKHAVSRLIGAPPGYVGYEEGGLLIDAVRKSPHAVLLLDEIEKAHPDMYAILLQVMDHATLTDSHGRKADFRHVVLIMTTNVGARDVSDRRLGLRRDRAGRLDARRARADLHAGVPQPAGRRGDVRRAGDGRGRARRGQADRRAARRWSPPRTSTIELDPAARSWLAQQGFDRAFGARPMARLVDRVIKKPLSERLLFGSLAAGGTVRIAVKDDAIVLVEDAAAWTSDLAAGLPGAPLLEADAGSDPVGVFLSWFRAAAAGETDANAMALATVAATASRRSRMVLLKELDARGLDLLHQLREPQGATTWRRTIAPRGVLLAVDRPAGARRGPGRTRRGGGVGRVLRQSRPIEAGGAPPPRPRAGRSTAARRSRRAWTRSAARSGDTCPGPPRGAATGCGRTRSSSGRGGPNRLHDRLRYERHDGGWRRVRLAP